MIFKITFIQVTTNETIESQLIMTPTVHESQVITAKLRVLMTHPEILEKDMTWRIEIA